jgi:hypothetical protein
MMPSTWQDDLGWMLKAANMTSRAEPIETSQDDP